MKRIVLATKNEGKLREIRGAFAHLPVEVVSLAELGTFPDAVEDGETFEQNARIKAEFYRQQTHEATLADDSGLEIAALGGAPGVHSARFAGGVHASDAANNQKMLEELGKKGISESPADYRCVLHFCDTDGAELTAEGRVDGVIRTRAHGENGFGYDPYFYIGNRTMADMTPKEKGAISHRGKALRELVKKLEDYLK